MQRFDPHKSAPSVRRTYPRVNDVRLLPGTPFYDRQQDMNRFLLDQDPDSLLYNFRKASGLDTRGAAPMTGWDADECKLKGHTTGHYLSAVSLAYAATGDERFRDRAEYLIEGLAECQASFASSGRTQPGFLSAYDEEQFDLLEVFTKYPDIWAPYYTLDKIMAGLLDAYELAGIKGAADILAPLGDWVSRRLSRLTEEQRTRMWSMYIAGEYGAMIGTLVRLYRITGNPAHLSAARLFENDNLYGQMAEGRDGLSGMHANQHIPQIIGAIELYRETGDERYYRIAENFWNIVTGHHCYVNGGTGDEERFTDADSETSHLTEKTAESCASVNMLRLTHELAAYAVDPCILDYYENTLFNHILMSQSHRPDGGTTYFMPLAAGSSKYYEREENSCCHGTGLESRYRWMDQIFSYEDDVLKVELPVSAQLLRFEQHISQDDDAMSDETTAGHSPSDREAVTVIFTEDGTLTVRADEDMTHRLAVRIPSWAELSCIDTALYCIPERYSAAGQYPVQPQKQQQHRGEHLPEITIAGRYACTEKPLSKGETVSLRLPMKLRYIDCRHDPRYTSIAYGPYILAAISVSKDTMTAPDLKRLQRSNAEGLEFRCGDTQFLPLYNIDTEPYHIYFKRWKDIRISH